MIAPRRNTSAGLGLAFLVLACDGGPTGPRTGSLTVNVGNLPADVAAAITVQGAAGTPAISVSGTRTISDLEPGTYTVTATKTVGQKASYLPGVSSQTVEVSAGTTPATVSVAYTLSTGLVNIVVSGVPAGTGAITLLNNAGFLINITSSREVGNLDPGEYSLQVLPVSVDEVYAGTSSPATFAVTATPTPVQAQVTYVATTGSIELSATGLPAGAVPTWDISGPGSFVATRSGAGAQTVSKLAPGTYTVSARNFDVGPETYGASTQSQSVTVTAGTKAPAVFAYITRPPTLNISVEGAYITQSTQRFDGSVPLIAGRDAFLRVFLKANELNSATPRVRVRLYRAGALVLTSVIDAPGPAVGTMVRETTTPDSWGMSIPGALVTGGFSFLVDADPDNTVRETSEADNTWPASGSPATPDVRSVPPAELRFVPIATSVNSLVGNVNDARLPELLALTLRMFPISAYSADVRAVFTTNAPALQANGDSWVTIINELNALRIAEGTSRHYIGILKTPYSGGVVGIGFLPGKTALSWDAGSGAASSTIAHELGHNWGRAHAPCGNPGGRDASYPYPNGTIGVYGFDLVARVVMDAGMRDVMSYCSPSWVSDYTYLGIMGFRGTTTASVSSSVQSTLMIWGRSENGQLTLEPAFMTDTRPSLPVRAGSHRIDGLDASGAVVFSFSFEPDKIEDAKGSVSQFGFAVPVSAPEAARIATLRLTANGREVRSTRLAALQAPEVTATTVASGKVRLDWNSTNFPMLVVRDPDTKEIIAFARGGSSTVSSGKRSLDVTASNRVSSTRLTVPARN